MASARPSRALYSKLDTLAETINTNHLAVIERITILETSLSGVPSRVTALEQLKYQVLGAVSILSAIISLVVTWLRRHA